MDINHICTAERVIALCIAIGPAPLQGRYRLHIIGPVLPWMDETRFGSGSIKDAVMNGRLRLEEMVEGKWEYSTDIIYNDDTELLLMNLLTYRNRGL